MQLSQSLLFDKYTYSFFIIGLQFLFWSVYKFNRLAGRLDLENLSFYDSTTPITTSVNYPRLPATGDHQRQAIASILAIEARQHAAYSVVKIGDRDKPG